MLLAALSIISSAALALGGRFRDQCFPAINLECESFDKPGKNVGTVDVADLPFLLLLCPFSCPVVACLCSIPPLSALALQREERCTRKHVGTLTLLAPNNTCCSCYCQVRITELKPKHLSLSQTQALKAWECIHRSEGAVGRQGLHSDCTIG